MVLAERAYYWSTHFAGATTAPPPETVPAVTTARFTALSGTVMVKASGTFDWVAADRRTPLKRNDSVRTQASSTAEVTFFDGTLVHVRPDSLIVIEESSLRTPAPRPPGEDHRSRRGVVNFTTPHQGPAGSAAEFSTQTFRANAAADTEGAVSAVQGTGEGEVKIFRGRPRSGLRAASRSRWAATTALPIGANGKAGPRIVLPDMPVLRPPPTRPRSATRIPHAPPPCCSGSRCRWPSAYHVMLDTDANFTQPLVDRRDIKDPR